jgi:hypothetical protein
VIEEDEVHLCCCAHFFCIRRGRLVRAGSVAPGRTGEVGEPLSLTRIAFSPQKLTRKLVHIICGPGFVLTWLLFRCSHCHPSLCLPRRQLLFT